MKRIVSAVLSVLFVFSFSIYVKAEEKTEINVSAEAYVLYCADNGQIISSKNERYIVKSVHHTTRNNEYILRQDLTLSKLPMSDVAYRFVFLPEEAHDYYGYKNN